MKSHCVSGPKPSIRGSEIHKTQNLQGAKEAATLNRWHAALTNAVTEGCSGTTARCGGQNGQGDNHSSVRRSKVIVICLLALTLLALSLKEAGAGVSRHQGFAIITVLKVKYEGKIQKRISPYSTRKQFYLFPPNPGNIFNYNFN